MPILFKLLIPVCVFLLNVDKLVPYIMIAVIYGCAFFFLSVQIISNKKSTREDEEFKGYRYLGTHILLYLITFGMWQLVWTYKTTKYVNIIYPQDKMKPVANIILCLLVPFYSVFWGFKVARRVDKFAERSLIKTRISAIVLIIGFFSEAAASLLIQSKINEAIYKSYKIHSKSYEKTKVCERYLQFKDNYTNIIKHFLLLFVTFGMWRLVWVCRTTHMLNSVEGESYRGPVKKMLLVWYYVGYFIPFYYIYWTYKTAKRVDNLCSQFNLDSDITKSCLACSFLVFGVDASAIIIQSKINELALYAEEGNNNEYEYSKKNSAPYTVEEDIEKYYYNPALFIIGSIIFFGVFRLIWIYRTTKVLNNVKGAKYRSPICQTILCIILPIIYYLVWIEKTAKIVDSFARGYKIDSWVGLPLWFVGLLWWPYVIQIKMNEVVNVVIKPEIRYDN